MSDVARVNLDPRKTLPYRLFRALIATLWFIMFRPRIVGTENIPATGPVLLAPIHRSNIDFAFVIFATKRKTFFMAKDNLWKVPLLRELIQTMGAFPVRRGTADRASLSAAQSVLENGQCLVLFPEGTRQEGNEVGALLDGASFIAHRAGCPIVPIGLGNTERAMKKGAKLPRPVRVTMVIGEPIAPVGTPDVRLGRSELTEQTTALRNALQNVYNQARVMA